MLKIKRKRKVSIGQIMGAFSPEMVGQLVSHGYRYWRKRVPIGPPPIGQHERIGLWPKGRPGQLKKSITKDYKEGTLSGRIFTKDPAAPSIEFGTKSYGAQPAFRPAKKAGQKKLKSLIRKLVREIRKQNVG